MKRLLILLLSFIFLMAGMLSSCNLIYDWTEEDEIALNTYIESLLDGVYEILNKNNMSISERNTGVFFDDNCHEDCLGTDVVIILDEVVILTVDINVYLDKNHNPQLHAYYLSISTTKQDTIEKCLGFLGNDIFRNIVNYLGFYGNADMDYIKYSCQKTQEMLNNGEYRELEDAVYSLHLEEKLDKTNECVFSVQNDLTKMKDEEKYDIDLYLFLSKCPYDIERAKNS